MHASLRFPAIFVALALLGAGCFGSPESPMLVGLDGTPTEAAQAIQFMTGDAFDVKQFEQERQMIVQNFAPLYHAEISWAKVNGQAATGTVSSISLKNSHQAFVPAYWIGGVYQLANEKTGIWLSDDAFQELSRTRQTILNYGVLDEGAKQFAIEDAEFKTVFDELRTRAGVDGKNHDLTLLKADPEPIEWKIFVNGKERTVSVIRARNWFGEIVVLNNRQNPLVLKMTINQDEFMDKVFGYEVANIVLKR